MEISDKEFAVIREISNNHQPNQRIIAKSTGISLGMTNIIIKRLIKKGYIKIHQIPPYRVGYMLTPKGLAEKAKKSYDFTKKTISLIKTIRSAIQDIVMEEYSSGARQFILLGSNELSILAEIAIRDLNLKDISYSKLDKESDQEGGESFLVINIDGAVSKRIDILQELAQRNIYLSK